MFHSGSNISAEFSGRRDIDWELRYPIFSRRILFHRKYSAKKLAYIIPLHFIIRGRMQATKKLTESDPENNLIIQQQQKSSSA